MIKREEKAKLILIAIIMVTICFGFICILAGLILYRLLSLLRQPKPQPKKSKATLLAELTITETKIWEIPTRAAACSSRSLD